MPGRPRHASQSPGSQSRASLGGWVGGNVRMLAITACLLCTSHAGDLTHNSPSRRQTVPMT